VEAALPLWENIAEDMVNLRGEDSLDGLVALANLGRMYLQTEEFERATSILARVRKISNRALEPQDINAVVFDHYYATALELSGDLQAALKIRSKLMKLPSLENPEYLHLRNDLNSSLGGLHLKLNQPKLAKPLLQQAGEGISTSLSPDHPIAMKIRANLAMSKTKLGDHTGAIQEYRDILKSHLNQFPVESAPVATAKINLAAAIANGGDAEEALELMAEVGEETEDRSFFYRAKVEQSLIKFLLLDQRDESIAELKTLVTKISAELGENHSVAAHARSNLRSFQAKLKGQND